MIRQHNEPTRDEIRERKQAKRKRRKASGYKGLSPYQKQNGTNEHMTNPSARRFVREAEEKFYGGNNA